jgi:uncharacterized membrane protein (UPF0127 family)
MRYVPLFMLLVTASLAVAFAYQFLWIEGGEGRVCFDDSCFNVSVAMTPAELSRGLMGIDRLGADRGMLFVFDREGDYPFWMEGTRMPLDIIWLDSNYTVVFIIRYVQPCTICKTIDPGTPSMYVLEVNAGMSKNISVGDRMTFTDYNL